LPVTREGGSEFAVAVEEDAPSSAGRLQNRLQDLFLQFSRVVDGMDGLADFEQGVEIAAEGRGNGIFLGADLGWR